VFTAHAVVAIAYAIPMLAAPAQVLATYGLVADGTAIGLARLLAAAFATFATVAWASRDLPEVAGARVAGGFALGLAIGAVVAVWNQLTTTGNAMGWSSVVVYAGLAFAYWRASASREAPAGTRLQAG
jgi:hypothetical protein